MKVVVTLNGFLVQERLADKEARSQAAQERSRLKTQDAAKKRQLDKLRQDQNTSVDDGEVGCLAPLLLLFMTKLFPLV